MAELTPQKIAVLKILKLAGRKGVLIPHGMHTVTHEKLVEEGLIWQEHGPRGRASWKFSLSPAGFAALSGEKDA